MIDQPAVKIAHLVWQWLPLTENWIYHQIVTARSYCPVVLAYQKVNPELFSIGTVYSLIDDNSYPGVYYQKFMRKFITGYFPYFKKIIKEQNIRLLHSHFGTNGYFTMLLNRDLRLPQVVTFYGYDASSLAKSYRWRQRYQLLFKEADLFLVEGGRMKQRLMELGCQENKIVVQHLGVDLTRLHYTTKAERAGGDLNILIAASFVEKKGLPYALRAFALVAAKHPKLKLTVIGDGKMRKELEVLVQKLAIGPLVKFMGYATPDKYLQAMADADIFLSPSVTAADGDTEGGSPVTLIEAQALGTPVVSTFHADIPEVVIDGQTGLLSKEKDVAMLANNLEKLVKEPDLRRKMGYAGRKNIADNYDLSNQAQKLEKIYASLLQDRLGG